MQFVANKLNNLFPLAKTFNPKRGHAISTSKPNLVNVKGSNKQPHGGADRLQTNLFKWKNYVKTSQNGKNTAKRHQNAPKVQCLLYNSEQTNQIVH